MTRSMWTVKAAAAMFVIALGLVVATAALAADDKKPADDKQPADDKAKADAKNLLKESNKAESWRLEQHESGKGTMKADEDGVLFEVTTAGDESWHVQAFLTGLELKEGKDYTLTYKAKADPARAVTAVAGIDEEDWHTIGLQEDADLTTEWKEHKHTFTASDVHKEKKNRIGFMLAGGKGKVWIKDASLTEKE